MANAKSSPHPALHEGTSLDVPRVISGAAVLARDGFAALSGKRVGLITNQTGRVGQEHLIDLLARAENVTLAAIFAPEHGVLGRAEAGESVSSTVDKRTRVPIHSLYGKTRKPTPDMLAGLDVLVFDIQDVGARFYTYISTMGLAMQAAAEAGVAFMVLDRPNPLGGNYLSGFVAEDRERSFVGQYPIPIAHGMTAGELARMIQGENFLTGLERLELSVVPMQGWERAMRWPDLGAEWVATSPNIDAWEAALLYAGIGLFEATTVSEGRGTKRPFRLLGADWMDARRVAAALNETGLPGVVFKAVKFKPRSIKGRASRPRYEDETVPGVSMIVTGYHSLEPVELGVIALHVLREHARARARIEIIDRVDWLAKMAGTRRLFEMLSRGHGGRAIIESWKDEVERFRSARAAYLLYE